MDCETGWIGYSRRCRRTADVHESQAAFWEETKRKRRADQIDGVMGGRIEDWLLACISNCQGWGTELNPVRKETIGIERTGAKGPKRTQKNPKRCKDPRSPLNDSTKLNPVRKVPERCLRGSA